MKRNSLVLTQEMLEMLCHSPMNCSQINQNMLTLDGKDYDFVLYTEQPDQLPNPQPPIVPPRNNRLELVGASVKEAIVINGDRNAGNGDGNAFLRGNSFFGKSPRKKRSNLVISSRRFNNSDQQEHEFVKSYSLDSIRPEPVFLVEETDEPDEPDNPLKNPILDTIREQDSQNRILTIDPDDNVIRNIKDWLISNDLTDYEDMFFEHNMTLEYVKYLDEDNLAEMGVDKIGDRLRIMECIKNLTQVTVVQEEEKVDTETSEDILKNSIKLGTQILASLKKHQDINGMEQSILSAKMVTEIIYTYTNWYSTSNSSVKRLQSLLQGYLEVTFLNANSGNVKLEMHEAHSRVVSELKDIVEATRTMSDSVSTIYNKYYDSLFENSTSSSHRLWNKIHPNNGVCPWNKFKDYILNSKLKITEQDLAAVKNVVDPENLDIITPERYVQFTSLFGDLNENCIRDLKFLSNQPYFYGFFIRDDIVAKSLESKIYGTFLVRFLGTKIDALALEYISTQNSVEQCIINRQNGTLFCDGKKSKFKHLKDVLENQIELLSLRMPYQFEIGDKPYFFDISADYEVEALLKGQQQGTYLLYFSENQHDEYLNCSYVGQDQKLCTYNLYSNGPGWSINNENYGSIEDLLVHYGEYDILKFNYSAESFPNAYLETFEPGDHHSLRGPMNWNENYIDSIDDMVACEIISTYPSHTLGHEIICDSCAVKIIGNRLIIALADGCNWGPRPATAAQRASRAFVDYFARDWLQDTLRNTENLKKHYSLAFDASHKAITANIDDMYLAGQSTLLGGMLTKLKSANDWAFTLASVGDCKSFYWDSATGIVTDITSGNRINLHDATDCGGRLGPYHPNGDADYSNYGVFMQPCKQGDLILVVSDGVHDNFDPEHLGLGPRDMNINYEKWEDVPYNVAMDAKSEYMIEHIAQLINDAETSDPATIASIFTGNSYNITQKTRSYMEEDPFRTEPKDYGSFPGKMDHTSCICIKVG
eukprot:TRINITY_DN6321_c0_g2_i1.p1 TRINITY_DN6321_c0_g2~~TRINITY_DN6321_c0_g2_i1.p1  ORF type:complete len:990 (-),score=201.92 TRINITY_DN6321_c0_g2_i1:124-3093(-)